MYPDAPEAPGASQIPSPWIESGQYFGRLTCPDRPDEFFVCEDTRWRRRTFMETMSPEFRRLASTCEHEAAFFLSARFPEQEKAPPMALRQFYQLPPLDELADAQGLKRVRQYAMPTNNCVAVWRQAGARE